MKTTIFIGNSRECIRNFPDAVRQEIGMQIFRIQQGLDPEDWKPMKTVGAGVREIRIHAGDEYRTLYVANIGHVVYILHAFQKKTLKTSKKDIDLARKRYKQIGGLK